jgi:hypothetical protein
VSHQIRWLFDSRGKPIAFADEGGHVFTADGRFFGRIAEHSEAWHGRYRGEIVPDDRLLFDPTKHRGTTRGHGGTPGRPLGVSRPPARAAIRPPGRLCDAELRQEE